VNLAGQLEHAAAEQRIRQYRLARSRGSSGPGYGG
jgi:hypothetical protein